MKNLIFAIFIASLISSISFSQTNKGVIRNSTAKKEVIRKKKRLVYLYTSNGGMLGYFSDGTVVGCPKCDFIKSNVIGLYDREPIRRWNLKKPDDFTSYKEDKGWVLINYKWKVKVPQD